jgi:hypothetical protein
MQLERLVNLFTKPANGRYPKSNEYMSSHPTSLQSTFMLTSHLHLRHPSNLFPLGFRTKILYVFILSPMCTKCHASSS